MKLSAAVKGYLTGMALGIILIFIGYFFHPDFSKIKLLRESEKQLALDRCSGKSDILLDSVDGYVINKSIFDFYRMNIGKGRLWRVVKVDNKWLIVFIGLESDKLGRAITDFDMVYIYDIQESIFIGKFWRPFGWHPGPDS
ncbi:MAG: hypothetical protein LBC18_08065 [Opitutaceae bacterium]|nr:hypothetical protein [Opitutaceae bacterium]